MKKILTVLTIVGMLASCKDKKKDAPPEPKPAEPTVTAPVNSEVPKFADPEVQAHAQAYQDLANDYKKAVEAKDKDKIWNLGDVNSKLITESGVMFKKLADMPEENKKLSDFIIEKGKQIDASLKEWNDYEQKKMQEGSK